MDKKIILTLAFVPVFALCVQAQLIITGVEKGERYNSQQDVKVEAASVTLKEGELSTSKTLTISSTTLKLGSINISAKKIILKSTVKTIMVTGNVVLEAEEIEVENEAAMLKFEGVGTITFLYKTLTAQRAVSYQPVNGQNLVIEFKKKN